MPLAKNVAGVPWRDHVVVESLHGRSLSTDRYKYSIYASGKNREQLVDLNNDPGEMRNLADNADCKEILEKHRELLSTWVKTTDDVIAAEYLHGANKR
jgi:arylsulfatase A-like enzyme